MKISDSNRFFLKSAIPYGFTDSYGFFLPVFYKEGSDLTPFAQEIDEISGKIIGFRQIENISVTKIELESVYYASERQDQIFVFSEKNQPAKYGTIVELKQYLQIFLQQNPDEIEISLQIASLLKLAEYIKNCNLKMFSKILRLQNMEQAKIFRNSSILKVALWDKLVAEAPTESAARRILSRRFKINLIVDSNNKIKIDTSMLDKEDFSQETIESTIVEFEQLVKEIDENIKLVDKDENANSYNGETQKESPNEILGIINRAGRQEERIALLLYSILSSEDSGKSVVKIYNNDRSKFASHAINLIKSSQIMDSSDNSEKELSAAVIINKLYKKAFPHNRGYLLYYIAEHLSQYKHVRDLVSNIIDKTNSSQIFMMKDDINNALERRNINKI